VSPLRKILTLWQVQSAYLALGAILALAALAAGIALMANAGHYTGIAILGGALVVPVLLQLAGAARVVFRYTERLVSHDAMFRALTRVRIWFFLGLARSAAGGLGFRRAGDVLARLVNDVEALDGLYLRIIVPALGVLLLIPILIIVLAHDSAIALLALLPFLFIAVVLPTRAAKIAKANAHIAATAMAGLRNAAIDALSGLREVKIFGAESRMLGLIKSREAAVIDAQATLAVQVSRLNMAGFLAAQGAILLVLLAGLTAPPLAAIVAVFVLTAAFEAVQTMPRAGVLLGQSRAAAALVVAAAQAPPPVPDPVIPVPMPTSHALTFEHVSFRYAEGLPFVFENLSLQLPAGSRTGILGPSGAGKSTIASLLLKLHAPTAGRIRLGAADLAILPAEAVRGKIAYLSQATHLFADTIRNNLLLGDPAADDAKLWAALDAAKLAETIRALPDGLSTWLGEAGGTLSGGQGRRLALARTLLSSAPILILDEPCAGLDLATETAFYETLNTAVPGRTLLLIAHRLTGVEKLDRIWRLAGGTLMAAAG
jgi:ATP-binding cassette subfamily C protein CydC